MTEDLSTYTDEELDRLHVETVEVLEQLDEEGGDAREELHLLDYIISEWRTRALDRAGRAA